MRLEMQSRPVTMLRPAAPELSPSHELAERRSAAGIDSGGASRSTSRARVTGSVEVP